MFAKIFSQIFDSSIAENYQTRHIFMDLLVMADSDGVIDMTIPAIARRANVPLDVVTAAVQELCQPDTDSRTPGEEGRRLLPIDPARGWGWQVVNYAHYRAIRDEERRREYFRDYRRKEREEKRPKKPAKPKEKRVKMAVHSGPKSAANRHAEANGIDPSDVLDAEEKINGSRL